MSTDENDTHTPAEEKLLAAVLPQLERLSDEEIAARISATEEILASRARSRGASLPMPAAQHQ